MIDLAAEGIGYFPLLWISGGISFPFTPGGAGSLISSLSLSDGGVSGVAGVSGVSGVSGVLIVLRKTRVY